jgi:hypothetical protein
LFVTELELDRLVRDEDFVNLRGDAAPIKGVGVELVISLNGDFSSLRDGLNASISTRKEGIIVRKHYSRHGE